MLEKEELRTVAELISDLDGKEKEVVTRKARRLFPASVLDHEIQQIKKERNQWKKEK